MVIKFACPYCNENNEHLTQSRFTKELFTCEECGKDFVVQIEIKPIVTIKLIKE